MEKKFGAFTSSVNPSELSLTVTSIAKLVIALLVSFGFMSATGADTTLEQIPVIVSSGVAAYEAIQAIWGAIRKVIVKMSQ